MQHYTVDDGHDAENVTRLITTTTPLLPPRTVACDLYHEFNVGIINALKCI
jgi:hypothetical protein